MNWNDHSKLEGSHACFSASQPSWLNYSQEDVIHRYCTSYSTEIGTVLHDLARRLILYKIKLKKNDYNVALTELVSKGIPKKVINLDEIWPNFCTYVNQAIELKMDPEVVLYYSPYCYGTADAISYSHDTLRIHDLKTGTGKVHPEQLLIYSALACLEYNIDPNNTEIILQIYQTGNDIMSINPPASTIVEVGNKIIEVNKIMTLI